MKENPIFPALHPNEARAAIAALRSDATCYDAQNNPGQAEYARGVATKIERHLLACRPLVYRAALAEVVVDDEAAIATAVRAGAMSE